MNKINIKLAISTLVLTLGVSGCSFNLVNRSNNKKIVAEYDYDYTFNNNNPIDNIFDIKKETENKIDYNYLIDSSEYTRATLAHVIADKTITSRTKMFENKKGKPNQTFDNEAIQPIIIPQIFRLNDIDKMSDLIDRYGECEVNCKKLFTLEGDTLYYLDSTFTFNEFAEKFFGFDVKAKDTINAKILYKFNDDNTATILYRNQTGIESRISNVKDKNFNNEKEIIIPVEKTIFNDLDGYYKEEYLKEALDAYNGTDEYYSINNEGIDFNKFKK